MKRTAEQSVTSILRTPGRRILSIGVLVLLGVGVACKAKPHAPPPAQEKVTEEVLADTAPPPPPPPLPVPVATIEVRASCDRFLLVENGTGAVQMGDARDSVRARCRIISDSTVADQQGIHGGLVISVGSSSAVAQIADDRVNGLFVTDTLFRTIDGLGPGTLVRSLLEMNGATVLEGLTDLSIVVEAHCGLFFRIPKPAAVPQNGQRWRNVAMALPPDTRIERVVVRGCH